MIQPAEDRVEAADSWQRPPPAPKPPPAAARSDQDSFAQLVDDAFQPSSTQPPSSNPQIGRAISQPSDWEGLPPSYQSLFPRLPPAYASLFPVNRIREQRRTQRRTLSPRRAARRKRRQCGIFFLLVICQVVVIALVANALKNLEIIFRPVAEIEFGLAVVLAAAIAEVVFIFTIAPCLYCIANGAGFFLSFSLLAAEVIGTSIFLFYCVGLDMQSSTCDEFPTGVRKASCERALERAIAIGVLRVLITAPVCISITVAFVRERWGRRWRRIRVSAPAEQQPEIGTAL